MQITQKDLAIQKPLAPVYLLYGTQSYLIQLLKKNIVAEALTKDERDFNLSRYDMLEVSVETALEDAETLPFIGEKRVVILENPYFLTNEKPKTKVEHNLSRFIQYLENPAQDTVLIVYALYEKLDKRKKLVKKLEKAAKIYELSKLSDTLVFQLLKNIAGQYGAVYTRSGHEQLVALTGTHLMQLANEVKKCALFCGEEREIDQQVVLELGSRSLESNVFLLVDQIMKRQTAAALKLLHDLVIQKEEPIKLLALISRQLRIVYQVGYYRKAGYTQQNIAGKIGVHPYAVKLAAEQTKFYSQEALKAALSECTETDFQMKVGAMDKTLALELLIHQISGGR